jgi:hypothetical protein
MKEIICDHVAECHELLAWSKGVERGGRRGEVRAGRGEEGERGLRAL